MNVRLASIGNLLVVHLCQRSVSLLTCSVPHLKLDDVLVQLNILRHERASDGRFMSLTKLARVVPDADAGFADTHVAKKDDFVGHSGLIRRV